ncbi:MAG: NTP transferase domain-containing protein [Verrucomicrobiae bacterium]|nr:NTP transferase domain-containing protein [Verrucomicrobiae bacterium]
MAYKHSNLFLFILAGGSGERFWPLSRSKKPKHLLTLFSKKTLLEETLQRVKNLVPPRQLFILTNAQQKKLIRQKLPHFPIQQIIIEPKKRDTAPAAALATAIARKKNPNAIVGLLPADHLIKKIALFQKNLQRAITTAAQNETLVTIGISPTFPATGFGYLKIHAQPKSVQKGLPYNVNQFLEKPDLATAKKFLKQKNYFWNAGIFFWNANYFFHETQKYAPDLAHFLKNFPTTHYQSYLRTQFPKLKKISLDYALAEKVKTVKVIIAEFDWNDVGSWEALVHYFQPDENNNILIGKAALIDCHNNIIVNKSSQFIALIGVKDTIFVVTKDATLTAHRSQNQAIKKLFARLPIHFR